MLAPHRGFYYLSIPETIEKSPSDRGTWTLFWRYGLQSYHSTYNVYYISNVYSMQIENGEDFSSPFYLQSGFTAVGFTALVTTKRCMSFAVLRLHAPHGMIASHISTPFPATSFRHSCHRPYSATNYKLPTRQGRVVPLT